MFGTLGGPELFLIFVVALIVFGPRKLPEIGKSLGRMMSEFRRASNEFKSTIESEVESEKIRESMRIEAPRVTPVKARSPETGGGAPAGAPGSEGAETEAAPEATTPAEPGAAPPNPAAGEASAREAVTGEGKGGEGPSAEGGAGAEPVPSTVSRQPPAPETK